MKLLVPLLLGTIAFCQTGGAEMDRLLNVDCIIWPQVDNPNSGIQFTFSNTGTKEISGFRIEYDATYANGKSFHGGGGMDLIGVIAQNALFGATKGAETLKPGATITKTWSVPKIDGTPPLLVKPRVVMLLFLDRSAIGEQKEIAFMLTKRAKEGREIGEAISEARGLLAKSDPDIALANRVRSLQEAPRQATTSAFRLNVLQLVVHARSRRVTKSDADTQILQLLEARCRALLEHSTLQQKGAL